MVAMVDFCGWKWKAGFLTEFFGIVMINRKFFFDYVRSTLFGGGLTSLQVAGLTGILDEWETGKWGDDTRWLAYMLATAHHETDRKMQPIEEYGKGKNYKYGKCVKMNGAPYTDTSHLFYGRGFVQLTWYDNYLKAGTECGIDLIKNPMLALKIDTATKIMFVGMTRGWFTGKKLSDYFAGVKQDWVNARRIINGTDKAQLIADYAKRYYAAISIVKT